MGVRYQPVRAGMSRFKNTTCKFILDSCTICNCIVCTSLGVQLVPCLFMKPLLHRPCERDPVDNHYDANVTGYPSSYEVQIWDLYGICSGKCSDRMPHTNGIWLCCFQWASILDTVYEFWAKYRLPVTGVVNSHLVPCFLACSILEQIGPCMELFLDWLVASRL